MNESKAAEVLEYLLDGVDPCTGEILPPDHVCAEPTVIRALHTAISALRGENAAEKASGQAKAPPRNRSAKLNAGRPWTKQDDEMLVDLYTNATPMEEICSLTQRRIHGVQKRLLYLGFSGAASSEHGSRKQSASLHTPLANAGRAWTKDDDLRLVKLYDQDWLISEIAEELGRSELSIFYRLDAIGLLRSDTLPAWTQQDTEDLRKQAVEGNMTDEQLARKYGRTVPAIQTRLFFMGLRKDLPRSIWTKVKGE